MYSELQTMLRLVVTAPRRTLPTPPLLAQGIGVCAGSLVSCIFTVYSTSLKQYSRYPVYKVPPHNYNF